MKSFHPTLQQYIEDLPDEFNMILEERRTLLQQLAYACQLQLQANNPLRLIVICTHNSRRSHMGQLWLQVAARYYQIPNVQTYSGGTEATAFHLNAVKAMSAAGFKIHQPSAGSNPMYRVTMYPQDDGQLLFSKKFDDNPNPKSGFIAIMVCSEADEGCPVIPGADHRFAIPFHDPKAFDNTPVQDNAYAERCRQIAREMFYAMSLVGA